MTKPFPKPISFLKLLGPSFIILALGLGSGEVILWPYLASNYGLGIFWAAVLGISCQYFINMEIERYALIRGESVFVGLNKVFPKAPYWFILSTFVGFGLPGIIAASAQVFAALFGIANFKWIAIAFLLGIGFMLSIGKTVYGLMERVTKTIILLGIPFIFVLVVVLAKNSDWVELGRGLFGSGNNFSLVSPPSSRPSPTPAPAATSTSRSLFMSKKKATAWGNTLKKFPASSPTSNNNKR